MCQAKLPPNRHIDMQPAAISCTCDTHALRVCQRCHAQPCPAAACSVLLLSVCKKLCGCSARGFAHLPANKGPVGCCHGHVEGRLAWQLQANRLQERFWCGDSALPRGHSDCAQSCEQPCFASWQACWHGRARPRGICCSHGALHQGSVHSVPRSGSSPAARPTSTQCLLHPYHPLSQNRRQAPAIWTNLVPRWTSPQAG